jgi:hypothetical protein
MRRQVEAKELVALPRPDRTQGSGTRASFQYVERGTAVAVLPGREDRNKLETFTVTSSKLRPDCADHPLDACLGVMLLDSRKVDQ